MSETPSQYGPVRADDTGHLMRVGDVAGEIDNEIAAFVRHAGGVTPTALQEYVGQYLSELQPMSSRDLGLYFAAIPARWAAIASGRDAQSVEEYLCELLLFVLRMGHERAFDVFQGSYELFELWLTNAQTAGLEARKRLRTETMGEA